MPGSPETAQEQGKTLVCYVYGIVPADVELTADALGLGDPPARVKLVRHKDIAALVSELDTSRPIGRPADLMAHEQILDAIAVDAPVLPLRFGATVTTVDAVVDELLEPHHDEFAVALHKLEGRAEYVVKGRYVERAVLSEVLAETPEAASLRDQIRGQPEDATRNLRIRLGEIVNQAIEAKRDADTRALLAAVTPYCVLSAVRPPTHEQDAAHLALLVEVERQKDLERVLEEFAREWDGRVGLRMLGPLAPYDFVETAKVEV
jgi:hypothetical protein